MTLLSMSSRSSGIERGHGFDSCQGVRFCSCPTLVLCWSNHLSHFITELRIHHLYYISKLVRALWLVNFAEILSFILLPNCCMIHRQMFLTEIASKRWKLSFTLNCVLKRANDLKTISNWLILLSTCFREIWSRFSGMKIVPEPVRHTIEI